MHSSDTIHRKTGPSTDKEHNNHNTAGRNKPLKSLVLGQGRGGFPRSDVGG
jgi:hypothetical protein